MQSVTIEPRAYKSHLSQPFREMEKYSKSKGSSRVPISVVPVLTLSYASTDSPLQHP